MAGAEKVDMEDATEIVSLYRDALDVAIAAVASDEHALFHLVAITSTHEWDENCEQVEIGAARAASFSLVRKQLKCSLALPRFGDRRVIAAGENCSTGRRGSLARHVG